MRRVVLVVCTLALGGTALIGNASAANAANGVSWFVNGKPAPTIMKAVVGRELGNAVKTYLDIKAKRKGPANEPLNGIACAYKGGSLKGGPPAFNDCGKVPGVDVCNRKPTISAESSGEDYGCVVPGSPT